MHGSIEVWMCVAGLVYLCAGFVLSWRALLAAQGWDRFIRLGPVLLAVALATFAPEHFAPFVKGAVPPWMPARWFWPYLVGCALLAAATSLSLRLWVRWSSTMLAVMLILFVCMIHIEGVLAHPGDRFVWTVMLRDLSFAAGAWALAGLYMQAASPHLSRVCIACGRIVFGATAMFFAIETFLHPLFAAGVPLQKLAPSWLPVPGLWAYLSGAVLLVAGICLILDRQARIAAAAIGAWITVLTIVVYLPAVVLAWGMPSGALLEALNYLADTLLYAGSALVLASALAKTHAALAQPSDVSSGLVGA